MANYVKHSEIRLVEGCLSGSEKAWEKLYSRYVGLVRGIVRRRMRSSPEEQEDMTQAVFLELLTALGSFDGRRFLPGFIATIAHRVCIQEYRTATALKRHGTTSAIDHHGSGQDGAVAAVSQDPTPEDRFAEGELIACMRDGLRELDPDCQELLRARYHDDLPYEEISDRLGLSRKNLAVRLHRCLSRLRDRCRELLGRNGAAPQCAGPFREGKR
jgi:RNA polymerase sigma-70 factor (ECF subfamily)